MYYNYEDIINVWELFSSGAGKEDKEHSSFVLKDPNDNEAFLSFGFGTRACLGQKFVIQGVATLFASLLERYEVCARSWFFFFLF